MGWLRVQWRLDLNRDGQIEEDDLILGQVHLGRGPLGAWEDQRSLRRGEPDRLQRVRVQPRDGAAAGVAQILPPEPWAVDE
jgi:hypothetical protein